MSPKKANSTKRARANGRAGPRKRAKTRGPRTAGPQMMGAPAGVSQDLQQFTKFLPSSNPAGIRLHTCVAISQVCKETVGTTGNGLLVTSGNTYMSAQLNLTDPAWLTSAGTKVAQPFITPVFDLIASAFVRYKIKKLVFHYEPQAAATDGQRLVFAFANDPLHPILWNATVPTSSALLTLSDSIAFMPWRAWSMDVSASVSKDSLYTYSDSSTTVAEFVERFSDFGVMSCITSGAAAAVTLPCGVLYLETEIELEEFCPISVTRPSSLAVLRRAAKTHMLNAGGQASGKPAAAKDGDDKDKAKDSASDDNSVAGLRAKLAALETAQ